MIKKIFFFILLSSFLWSEETIILPSSSFGPYSKREFTKPNGITLTYILDGEGKLVHLSSSDGTCAYTYTYDLEGRVTQIEDLLHGQTVERTFDERGNLLEETFPADQTIAFQRDEEGRRTRLTLPDGSSLTYTYEGENKIVLKRLTPQEKIVYTHTVLHHQGKLLEEELNGGEKISYTYDTYNRLTTISSPAGEEKISAFDGKGQIGEMSRFWGTYTYTYDDFSHITQEKGSITHTFAYDVNHNRILQDGLPLKVNEKNELLSVYIYDDNGNPIQKGDLSFQYDAFNRLCRIEKEKTFCLLFFYDGFHRKMQEKYFLWENHAWSFYAVRTFLYDHGTEIGSQLCTVQGENRQDALRFLEPDFGQSERATLLAELEGKPYAVIRDLCGNNTHLFDLTENRLVESYTFSAFKEENSLPKPKLPWRFAGKRIEPLSGLIYFGYRFYDPDVGRWLTPDPHPSVLEEHNLYMYAHQNPLHFSDPNGLESILSRIFSTVGTAIQNYCSHVVPFHGLRNIGILLGDFLGGKAVPGINYYATLGSVGTHNPYKPHINLWINGINTNFESATQSAHAISQACGGEKVYYVYNPTSGIMRDIGEHLACRLRTPTDTVELAVLGIRLALQEIGGVDTEGRLTIFAHSHGGLILSNALTHLTPEEKRKIEVYTFGTACTFLPEGLMKVEHIIATRDATPLFANPISYPAFCTLHPELLHFEPSLSGSPWAAHSFKGTVYAQEMQKIGKKIQEEFAYFER